MNQMQPAQTRSSQSQPILDLSDFGRYGKARRMTVETLVWSDRAGKLWVVINRDNGDSSQMGESCTLQHHSFHEQSLQAGS